MNRITEQIQPAAGARVQPKLEIEGGSKMYVRLNPLDGNSRPMRADFIGTVHYEFVSVRLPRIAGILPLLVPNSMVEVRYVVDGAVNTFMADVLSYTVKPGIVLYTSYPERVNVQETRRHQRLNCALQAHLMSEFGKTRGLIVDLSRGGCRAVFEMTSRFKLQDMPVGSKVNLYTSFAPGPTASAAGAVIRNAELVGLKLYLGLAFEDCGTEFSNSLNQYLTLAQSLL